MSGVEVLGVAQTVLKLDDFERYVYNREREAAENWLLALLLLLEETHGAPGTLLQGMPLGGIPVSVQVTQATTRIATAITCLLSDKAYQISSEKLMQFFSLQRWLSTIFAATDFVNADHVLRARLGMPDSPRQQSLSLHDLTTVYLLYFPESDFWINFDQLWASNKYLAASLGLALLSPRFLGSALAHGKREALLPYLAKKLPEIETVDALPVGILHDVYMHCSYADRPDKHDIKGAINELIVRWLDCLQINPLDTPPIQRPQKERKPVMVVLVERLYSSHVIYRTHSRTIEAARALFHVVGVGQTGQTDAVGRAVFDEFFEIDGSSLLSDRVRAVRDIAQNRSAQVFYMPSVGMMPLTMVLANLRLAPVMAMALGHPATTMSKSMDYVVVEEDYVGDATCFSETLLVLPKDGMPYRPSALADVKALSSTIRENPDVVQILVASSTIKINPGFMDACKKILETSKVRVHFHFAMGLCQGISYPQVKRVIFNALGEHVTVYEQRPYAQYMETIRLCDMFINPFPFGNTNGIIDAVSTGLVGVCKTGREVHEHIDQGLFERFGFPGWLVTRKVEQYVAAAVRLAEDHSLRNSLRLQCAGPDKTERVFEGRPEIMGEKLMKLIKSAATKNRSGRGNLNRAPSGEIC